MYFRLAINVSFEQEYGLIQETKHPAFVVAAYQKYRSYSLKCTITCIPHERLIAPGVQVEGYPFKIPARA